MMAKLKSLSSLDVRGIFDTISSIVFAVILVFLAISMVIGTARLFLRLNDLLSWEGLTGGYLYVFSDVLTLFILVELSRSLAEYFSAHRLRLVYILDAAIIFVLRDIMIALFQHKLAPDQTYALAALLLVLGVIRASSLLSFHRKRGDELRTERA